MIVSSIIIALITNAFFVFSTPSPNDLGSDLTILINNDLLGSQSPNADSGIILLSERSRGEAASDCTALGEELWAPELGVSSIPENLGYLVYQGKYDSEQQFWVAPAGSQPRAINIEGVVSDVSPHLHLPALCTQTAPFSNHSFQDNSPQWRVTVHSNNEYITGFRDRVSFRFLGIRYAQQPRRFTYSTKYRGSGTNVSATEYGSQCVQGNTGSEDCLFLNIWTPYLPAHGGAPKADLKPVMFWIHGGAFTSGTGNDPTFDGSNLASRGDVIVVAINYRLGSLGFLALDDGKTKGNYGLADQITALDWVRDNIQDFGGDPDRITIFGQSAGAASVRALMASPKSIGKFAGAIPQSNLAGSNYATTYSLYPTISQELTLAANAILKETNCSEAASQVDCLRELPAYTFTNIPDVARYVVVDGTYITSNGLPLDKSQPVANIHLMMGFMRDDGAAFIGYPTTTDLSSAISAQSFPANTIISSGEFPEPVGQNATLDVFNVTARVATDAEFRCLDQATAYAGVVNGLFKPDVYFYEFNRSYQTAPSYDPNAPVCDAPITPSHPYGNPDLEYFKCHSGELYFVFGTVLRMGLPLRDENDLPFEQFILDSWSSFARSYNPNPNLAFLAARGYSNTADELAAAGLWQPLSPEKYSFRELQWPSHQMDFRDGPQCDILGYPLDYYLNH
ncbi:Alpha/Beta hydrolase protein [Xylogone sp. PMI_703]|nr:Alpha/Beta hydrolase protein [Xylogone sp. PMI_703]